MADGRQPGVDKLVELKSNLARELCDGTEVAPVQGQNETLAVLKRERHKVRKA